MKRVLIYFIFLILAWTAAWLLYERLDLEAQSSMVEFIYWTTAKLIIWILPVILIIKFLTGEPVSKYLSFVNWKQGLKVGLIFGILFIGISFVLDIFLRGFNWPHLTIGFFSAVFLAPVLEETLFRGYFLGSMERTGHGFWTSNLVVSILFLGIHLPGWYFMGSSNLTQPLVITSILLIGVLAGYAKQRSGSTWGSIVFHFINNLYSSFIK